MLNYGVLSHANKSINFAETYNKEEINIGDYIQSIGVRNAYQEIGITTEQIVWVEKYSISGEGLIYGTKDNEYLVTLNNVYSGGGKDEVLTPFPTAKNIIPIFIGFNCLDESMIAQYAEYFKKWEPIGCRDEKTKEILGHYNIKGYITGCSSILLPERKEMDSQNKIFFVDIPESLKNFIPLEYQENSVFLSQNILKNSLPDSEEDWYLVETVKQLKKYENEAKLVVTSKLHCAAPCLAMGIPVILAVENIDDRFAWIDKFIPIYTNWNEIDWKIVKRDVGVAKELLINVYKDIISAEEIGNNSNTLDSMQKIDSYYMNRSRCSYNSEKVIFLKQIVEDLYILLNKKKLRIIIWGAGKTGGLLFNLITKEYPEINIEGFVDSFKTGLYKGKIILKPEELEKNNYDFIFLCSIPGRGDAIKKMNAMGLKQKRNYIEFYFESVVARNKNQEDSCL